MIQWPFDHSAEGLRGYARSLLNYVGVTKKFSRTNFSELYCSVKFVIILCELCMIHLIYFTVDQLGKEKIHGIQDPVSRNKFLKNVLWW